MQTPHSKIECRSKERRLPGEPLSSLSKFYNNVHSKVVHVEACVFVETNIKSERSKKIKTGLNNL